MTAIGQPCTDATQYQADEIVDLYLTGAKVLGNNESELVMLSHPAIGVRSVRVAAPDVRVFRAMPVEGIPQPGEIWADRYGDLYVTIGGGATPLILGRVINTDQRWHWQDVHRDERGPIRRVWTPPMAVTS